MPTSSPLFDINQLTADQQKCFHTVYNELKEKHTSYLQYKLNLELNNKYENEEEENEWNYELHRFLRARKWNIPHTVKALLEMIQWRIDNRVDSILEDQTIILRMQLLRKLIAGDNHGYTKTDRPLYIEKSGSILIDKLVHRLTTPELLQCHIYWLETNCKLARERSRLLGKHIECFAMINDLHHCKMDIRKILGAFKESLHIDNNYYPERLGHMFLVNPPTIFPALWNLVKHWLDPVTKTKILVIKKGPETASTLLQYIDADQLPVEYGGTCQTCPTSPDCIPMYDWSKETTDEKREEH